MAKDSVKTRLDSEQGMSFTEFSYQLLQGYDFVHLFRNEVGWCNLTPDTGFIENKHSPARSTFVRM